MQDDGSNKDTTTQQTSDVPSASDLEESDSMQTSVPKSPLPAELPSSLQPCRSVQVCLRHVCIWQHSLQLPGHVTQKPVSTPSTRTVTPRAHAYLQLSA